jgi:hypothetical protein
MVRRPPPRASDRLDQLTPKKHRRLKGFARLPQAMDSALCDDRDFGTLPIFWQRLLICISPFCD